jgi:hypothetical protein
VNSPSKLSKLVFVCLFSAACTYVTAVPTSPNNPAEGIPIPTVKPMLVVSGGQASILYVPNPNRSYALRFGSFLAKHDFNFDLQNAMLSKMDSKQNSTEVPIALINLISKAVEKGTPIGAAFSGQANDAAGGPIQVYDLIFSDDGDLIGVRPVLNPQDFIRMPKSAITRQAPQTPPGPSVILAPKTDPK